MSYFLNVTTFTGLFQAANNITGGLFIPSVMVAVWVILFMSTFLFGKSKALVFSSFICGLALLVLNMLGFVQYWLLIVDGLLFAVGIFFIRLHKTNT